MEEVIDLLKTIVEQLDEQAEKDLVKELNQKDRDVTINSIHSSIDGVHDAIREVEYKLEQIEQRLETIEANQRINLQETHEAN